MLMPISCGQDTMAHTWAHHPIRLHSGAVYIDKGDNRGRNTLSVALEEIHSLAALSPGDKAEKVQTKTNRRGNPSLAMSSNYVGLCGLKLFVSFHCNFHCHLEILLYQSWASDHETHTHTHTFTPMSVLVCARAHTYPTYSLKVTYG